MSQVLTQNMIDDAIGLLKKNGSQNEPLFCVHNRHEWLSGINSIMHKFTEEELQAADEKGFIKCVHGVDCYLSRFIKSIQ